MHLKRLKVRNFKSFAGSVEIPFQPGFTGIAGPNGMGKSNISDAILFVLGPTSSKALRADRLTHLFFNGGSSKKPATECEVSLVFDNKDRLIPSETDEVEVSRYVKLQPSDPDGYYSYFYINGRRTTQSEIDLLLSHARLSGDGYNLVQQGDVNRIVSMGPVPRRGLVERLAGISQYDEELERADTKRTALDGNLSQIQTLLSEIRSHLGALESQRLQAIQFKQLQDEKRRTEARLAHADLRLARHEVESCREMLAKVASEIQQMQADAVRQESDRDRISHEIDKAEQEIASRAGPEGLKFKAELDSKRLAFARLDQQFQGAEETLAECDRRLASLEGELSEARGTEKELSAREEKLAHDLAAVEVKARTHTAALKEATGGAEKSQGRLSDLRQKILIQEQQQQTRSADWQSSVQALEAARAQTSSSEREQAQAEEDEQTRQLELRDLELRIRQSRTGGTKGDRSSADLQKDLFQFKSKERTLSEQARALSGEVLELNRRYMALDARLKARADQNPRAGSLAAVEYLLSLRNLGKLAGIRGTVEELTRVEAEHHTALTVAAGARFQSLVVENDQVAEECINLLRSEKRGRATFLPLNRMLAGRPRGKSLLVAQSPGAVGFAVDLVKFEEELRPAFWYVFGETVVMKDLAGARAQMGGVRLVTLGGELIEATGAITGGFIDIGARARGGDSAVELRRLGEELREKSGLEGAVRAELDKIEPEIRRLSEELAKRSGEVEAQGSALKLLDKELVAARERLSEATARVTRVAKSRAESERARATAEKQSEVLEAELSQIQKLLVELNDQYHQQLPGSISGRLRSLQEAAEKASGEQLELAKQLETVRAQRAAAAQAVAAKDQQVSELTATRKQKAKEIAQLERARSASQEELEKLKTVETEQLRAVEGQTAAKRQLESKRLKLVEEIARAQEILRTRRAMQQNEEVRGAT
ncbi:MAG: AAA family ATPase, partial [Thermoplasmata archaeon]